MGFNSVFKGLNNRLTNILSFTAVVLHRDLP